MDLLFKKTFLFPLSSKHYHMTIAAAITCLPQSLTPASCFQWCVTAHFLLIANSSSDLCRKTHSKRNQARLKSQSLCQWQCGCDSQQSSSKKSCCAYLVRCRFLDMSTYCAFSWDKTRKSVTQWGSLQIPFLTFEIFAQVFLKCVHTSSICSEGKKRKKEKS